MNLSAGSRESLVRLVPVAVIVAAMLLIFAMGWHHAITLENIVALRDRFHDLLAKHSVLAVLIYVAVYVTVGALSLPGCLIMTLTGGLLFGWLVGGIAAVLAATTGATLVFLIARSAIAETNFAGLAGKLPWVPSVACQVERFKLDALLQQMRIGFKKDAMNYLLFLRLVPAFPFWTVNLVAAILGVPLKTYVIATFFGIIPATLAFATLGAGLDSVVAAAKAEYAACVAAHGAAACKLTINASSLVTQELVLAFALLGFAALIPVAYKRWRNAHAE
jgi:uncharacterized membrane protein YdjX (TVP38/TMEM64 family)